tara:strand:+ start:193 stop:636 length:444 start_codon:yes stop_codon:yes gene_type:complete
MVSPPPPSNPGHNADESPIERRYTNPDIPDFEALIDNQPVLFTGGSGGMDSQARLPGWGADSIEALMANQPELFASGTPTAPNTPVTFATIVPESTTKSTTESTAGPTAGPSPEIEDEDENNKLMIITGVSLCVCMMIVIAIFMMKR